MKKFMCILTIFVVSMFSIETAAKVVPTSTRLVLESAKIRVVVAKETSSSITYGVEISGAQNIDGYGLIINYNPNIYTFDRVMPGPANIFQGPSFLGKERKPGEVIVGNIGFPNKYGKGTICEVTLEKTFDTAKEIGIEIKKPVVKINGSIFEVKNIDREVRLSKVNFNLYQNYPNPFNPETDIYYSVSEAGMVEIVVYNALGQKIRTLVNEFKPIGNYIVRWDATGDTGNKLSSGVYFYRLRHGNVSSEARRMILLE